MINNTETWRIDKVIKCLTKYHEEAKSEVEKCGDTKSENGIARKQHWQGKMRAYWIALQILCEERA